MATPPAPPALTIVLDGEGARSGGDVVTGRVLLPPAAPSGDGAEVRVRLELREQGDARHGLEGRVDEVAVASVPYPGAPAAEGGIPFRLALPEGATPTRHGRLASVRWYVAAELVGQEDVQAAESEVVVSGPGDRDPGPARLDRAAHRDEDGLQGQYGGWAARMGLGVLVLAAIGLWRVAGGAAGEGLAWLGGAALLALFIPGVLRRRPRGPAGVTVDAVPRRCAPGDQVEVSAEGAAGVRDVGIVCIEHVTYMDLVWEGRSQESVHEATVLHEQWCPGPTARLRVPQAAIPSWDGGAIRYTWYAVGRDARGRESRRALWVGPPGPDPAP